MKNFDQLSLAERIEVTITSQPAIRLAYEIATTEKNAIQEECLSLKTKYEELLRADGSNYSAIAIIKAKKSYNNAVEFLKEMEDRLAIDFRGYKAPKLDMIK